MVAAAALYRLGLGRSVAPIVFLGTVPLWLLHVALTMRSRRPAGSAATWRSGSEATGDEVAGPGNPYLPAEMVRRADSLPVLKIDSGESPLLRRINGTVFPKPRAEVRFLPGAPNGLSCAG
jgi:hypothetical protein